MKHDVLIVASNIQVFFLSVDLGQVQSWDPVRQRGVLGDGKSFALVLLNSHSLEDRIAGIRFREYRLLGDLSLRIKPRDLRLLQSRMQLG